MGRLIAALTVWGALTAYALAFLSLGALAARLLGAPPSTVRLFLGPRVVRVRVGSTDIELGLLAVLPVAYVGFVDPTAEGGDGPSRLEALSRWRQGAVHAIPHTVIGIACVTVLGSEGLRSLAQAPLQLVGGALDVDTAHRLLDTLVAVSGTWDILPRLASKLVAFNLLPLPGLAGFSTLWALASPHRRPPGWTGLIGLVLLPVAAAWGWAAFTYVTA